MTEYERIKVLRKDVKRMTMEDFGKKLGISKAAISRIESGAVNLTEQNRISICREFNVSEQWLRTGEGEMFAERDVGDVIDGFFKDVRMDGGLKFQIVSILASLDEGDWEVIAGIVQKVAARASSRKASESGPPEPGSLEETLDRETEEFRRTRRAELEAQMKERAAMHAELDRQLDLEEETKGRSAASRSIA